MDVEEYVRRRIRLGFPRDRIIKSLADHIIAIKHAGPRYAFDFANAVIDEVENSRGLEGDFFNYEPSGVSMGEFGVGSRGKGDFFAHRQIAHIIGKTGASVGVEEMDDAGAVEYDGKYIICTVDGMHSRLSDYPFLAGFHVTRATLRDVYVMGARPIMLFSDIHVADDGDVAKIFDYTAGITAVGEAMNVPLVTGSTLRIGGDMVLGSRMTGCVGAVGVGQHLTARRSIKAGDVFLMTEGAGGGTIATTAIYSGFPDVVERTINLHFLDACETLMRNDVFQSIHAMTDVTNGGLRGDAFELAQTAGCRIVINEEATRELVEPHVLEMLENLKIDYLGVSIDALLVVSPANAAKEITSAVESAGVRIREIGFAEAGNAESVLRIDGKDRDFAPRFRESAYTPLKKIVDMEVHDFDEMKKGVVRASDEALRKKERVLSRLRHNRNKNTN